MNYTDEKSLKKFNSTSLSSSTVLNDLTSMLESPQKSKERKSQKKFFLKKKII